MFVKVIMQSSTKCLYVCLLFLNDVHLWLGMKAAGTSYRNSLKMLKI